MMRRVPAVVLVLLSYFASAAAASAGGCRVACGPVIAHCARLRRPILCRRKALHRCRRGGLASCDSAELFVLDSSKQVEAGGQTATVTLRVSIVASDRNLGPIETDEMSFFAVETDANGRFDVNAARGSLPVPWAVCPPPCPDFPRAGASFDLVLTFFLPATIHFGSVFWTLDTGDMGVARFTIPD
jgi:hypothetical protein